MSDSGQENEAKPTSFIPNSYSTPNAFVDKLMYLLEPKEWVVLSFICRHILGWKDKIASRTGALAITMIETGYEANGQRYMGCGLSRPTIVKAVEKLLFYKIIVKVGKPTRKGQFYRIPDDDSEINYVGLQNRIKEKFEKGQNRTKIAREQRAIGKSDIPIEKPVAVSPINRKRLMPLTDSGKSHLLNQNHIQPQQNHIAANAAEPSVETQSDSSTIFSAALEEPNLLSGEPPSLRVIKPTQPHMLPIEAWCNRLKSTQTPTFKMSNFARVSKELHEKGITAANMDCAALLVQSWIGAHRGAIMLNWEVKAMRPLIDSSLALCGMGIAPADVIAFVKERKTDPFWAGKSVSFDHVSSNIPTWKLEKSPGDNAPPELVDDPEHPGSKITPGQLRSRQAQQKNWETLYGDKTA